jgi:hypothetical protein
MKKLWTVCITLVLALAVSACGETGDSESDSAAAQNVQPVISGYTATNVDNVVDAFSAGLGASALASGNVPLAATIERVNTSLSCLEGTGALSGQYYVQDNPTLGVPQGGVSLIANTDRIQRNLLNCVTEQPFSAQAISIEPCFETGEFTYEGENFLYMYGGAGEGICAAFNQHFNNLDATVTSRYP